MPQATIAGVNRTYLYLSSDDEDLVKVPGYFDDLRYWVGPNKGQKLPQDEIRAASEAASDGRIFVINSL